MRQAVAALHFSSKMHAIVCSPTMRHSRTGTVTTAECRKNVASHGSARLANLFKEANWRNLGGSGHRRHNIVSSSEPIWWYRAQAVIWQTSNQLVVRIDSAFFQRVASSKQGIPAAVEKPLQKQQQPDGVKGACNALGDTIRSIRSRSQRPRKTQTSNLEPGNERARASSSWCQEKLRCTKQS